MFSKKNDDKKKNRERPRDDSRLAQFGLLGVGGMDDLNIGAAEEDALEQELLKLMQDSPTSPTTPAAAARAAPVPLQQLDQMVAECMDDGPDADVTSDDEEDPSLLAELLGLDEDTDNCSVPPINEPVIQRPPPVSAGHSVLHLLEARLTSYQRAEAQATLDNETARIRRFARGLKTLNQMKKAVLAGKAINEEDIPPDVVVKSSAPTPVPVAQLPTEPLARLPTEPVTQTPTEPVPQTPTEPVARLPTEPVARLPTEPVPQGHTDPLARSLNEPQHPEPATTNEVPMTQDGTAGLPRPTSISSLHQSVAFAPEHNSPAGTVSALLSQYKSAALQAKQAGQREEAVACMRIAKQLQPLLEAAKQGQPVDLDTLPAPPGQCNPATEAAPPPAPVAATDAGQPPAPEAARGRPVSSASILDSLRERSSLYSKQMEKAQNEGNYRKERQNQRIIKQYDDAIKKFKLGKPVNFDDLPTPPGFPPLPSAAAPPAPAPPLAPAPTANGAVHSPATPTAPAPTASAAANSDGPTPPKQPRQQQAATGTPEPLPAKTNVRTAPKSRVERQMSVLVKRQDQFRSAALDAKKRGEIEQAKEYLRNSKGLNSLIEATSAGLPVDMNTVPIPPQEQAAGGPTLARHASIDPTFEVINSEDCVVPDGSAPSDLAIIYAKLEEDLIQQIKMCATTREHFKAVGDVASSNRFEQLILHTKKDLDAVRLANKRGDKPPRCHYENRSFAIVQCNTDLNDSDCEVTVVRGINFNVQNPTDVDTFVRIEFPYPTDNNPQDRTDVVKDTNNPEYSHKILFSIDRKTRTLARIFKRHGVKLTVHAKGGWFHRDVIVGTAKVPLVALENTCTLHDSFDLSDERKKMVGGKLEVKIRVRNPILSKEVKQVNEKWLVIDGF